ncbi:hypothetical protein OFN33_32135, partial [Escherichia coli]|nr:hypothetical protein [Escherichia coli]
VDGLTPAVRAGGSEFASQAAVKAGSPSQVFDYLGRKTANLAGGDANLIAMSLDGGSSLANAGMSITDAPGSSYTGPGL